MSRLKRLIEEIHRRSLWQVLAIYLIGSWIGYQVIVALVSGLDLPRWFPAFAILLFIVLLPVVLATAFVQEGGPAISRRYDPTLLPELETGARAGSVPRPPQRVRRLFTWRNAIMGGVVAFALWGVVAAGWLMVRSLMGEGPVGGAGAEKARAGRAGIPDGMLSLESDPSGATVTLVAVKPVAEFSGRESLEIGRTPITGRRLSPGEYLVRMAAEDVNALQFLVRIKPLETVQLRRSLVRAGPLTEGMVLVGAGSYPGARAGVLVPAFLIDRYEVTNAEFQKFVAAGGYEDPTFWPETLYVGGRPTPWHLALRAFADRTGILGPRGWSGGTYAQGKGDHPVVGVSWYEAGAYARWARKELPTWDQWWRAALGETEGVFPWGDDVETIAHRANFGGIDARPVGSYPLGVSPFGAYDMAGNVREWLRDEAPQGIRRLVVAGSWQDPTYMFEAAHAEAFDPSFASEIIGFRCVRPAPGSP